MATPPRHLLLPPVFRALDGWLNEPSGDADGLVAAFRDLGHALGAELVAVRIDAPPLPSISADGGDALPDVARSPLRLDGEDEPIGFVSARGPAPAVDELVAAMELVLDVARARVRAVRAERQLAGLDEAVRGISGVLDLDRVLQLIADGVRDLVDAEYAAIGIVDPDGAIERFITSGIADEVRAAIGDLPHGRGLLGLIIRENRTFRIPEIADHPESYGFPPHHPPMHSFLGMPITNHGVPVGRLYLTNKRGAAEFSEDDASLVERFALHAGIAIENARLHEQVRRLAVVDERDRISRDLHDGVIQAIYAQTLALDDVPDLVRDEPDEAAARVDDAIDALHAVIRDIRNFIFGLRPVLLESGDVADGLRHLATELHRNGGVDVTVDVRDPDSRLASLPIEVVAEVLAITREALTNVARHAEAATCRVELAVAGDVVELGITDDGRGFDASVESPRGHHGLSNIGARARALDAEVSVTSAPGAGTRVIMRFRPRWRRTEDR